MNQPSPDPAVVYLEMVGDFDLSDQSRLVAMLRPAEAAETVIIDMSQTTYIDSTALGCLIHLKKVLLDRGGVIRLIGVPPNIRRLLEITKLDGLFEVYALPQTGQTAVESSRWGAAGT